MTWYDDERPEPNAPFEHIRPNVPKKKGRLKIYFGYAVGVGKTYAMLDDARELLLNGVDVVVGNIESRLMPETQQMMESLPAIPQKALKHNNTEIKEFDLDAALARKPELILVDELAHTNAEGVRNRKRYQDIEELLNAGIDVCTTVNVQHIESLYDVVQEITKVDVRETVPDYIIDGADKVTLVDMEPDELLKRLKEGKIYKADKDAAFTVEDLRILREIALRRVTDRISHENQSERRSSDKPAGMKLLVCVGPSPTSAKCIRWTARSAEAFHAPWVAVYVENVDSERLTNVDRERIQTNLDLASRLGAEIVILHGDDIAVILAEYSKLAGITNIVLGKSRNKKTLRTMIDIDFDDKLMTLLPDVEVHIIPVIPGQRPYRQAKKWQYLKKLELTWGDTLKTIGLLIAATLVSMALRAIGVGEQNTIVVYILSVLAVSRFTTGYAYGVAGSVLGVLAYNFFFTEPYYTLMTINSEDPITFLIMLIAALLTSALTVRIKTQIRLAVGREHQTELLYEINKKYLVTRVLENIINLTNEYISKIFGRSVVIFTQDPSQNTAGVFFQEPSDENAEFLLSEDERAVAHWVFENQKNAGAGTDTLMGAGGFYMPIISQGRTLGVVGLSCRKGTLEQDSRLFLHMLVSQTAMALERQYLSDEQHKMMVESEKEKMRGNLLRAISHDLRTPLTCIYGASATILENENLEKKTRDKLLSDIKDDSQWLIRMVENILSVTRINEGNMRVTKTPEAAEEIISEAVSRIRTRFSERKITVQIPEEVLLVPMDGTLIEQVLINLIENAVKHSPTESVIGIKLSKDGNKAVFEVTDSGEGIAEQVFPHLFEGSTAERKRSADSSRGLGIGLSICMSIIKAHDGSMEASNRPECGSVFRFVLPLKGENPDKSVD